MSDIHDPRLAFADWLHRELVREFAGETEPWALERAARVQHRLNEHREGFPALETTILWVPPPLAFTLAGSHVYVARSLFQRLPSDDALAFVLAHEAAHHDLGHLDLFDGWARWLPRSHATGYVAMLARLFEHHTYGPEREMAADEYAIRLAMQAGYDGDRSAQALAILEQLALDRGDIGGVFGPENLLDPTDPENDSTGYAVQQWVWTHLHGYLPLHARAVYARRLAHAIRDAVA